MAANPLCALPKSVSEPQGAFWKQAGILRPCHLGGRCNQSRSGKWTRISRHGVETVFRFRCLSGKRSFGKSRGWGRVSGWKLSSELEKKLRLSYPRSRVQKCVRWLWEKKIGAADLETVLNGEPQSRYEVLRSSHTPRNATRRACPGWLSRG